MQISEFLILNSAAKVRNKFLATNSWQILERVSNSRNQQNQVPCKGYVSSV